MTNEMLWAVIGALVLLIFRDVLMDGLRRLTSGQTLTLGEVSALKADVATLKQKQVEHDGMLVAVTELRTELKLIRESMATQPSLIAGVVSETIKATLQFVRVPKAA